MTRTQIGSISREINNPEAGLPRVRAAGEASVSPATDPGALAARREHVEQLLLAIPYPPTSNHNTMPGKGKKRKVRRILSPKYRAWRDTAEDEINRLSDGLAVHGPYNIQYVVERPDNRRRDVENIPKSISDALQAAGVIEDDADCQRSVVQWANAAPHKGARVWVTIEAVRT
jgi:crossover junction endodeoxyribonuclease RusA